MNKKRNSIKDAFNETIFKENPFDESKKEKILLRIRNQENKQSKGKNTMKWVAPVAAALILLMGGLNTSQVFAQSMANIPIIGSLVQVLTIREYNFEKDTYTASIKVPAIKDLENTELSESLNEKYLEENKQLYEEFMTEIEEFEKIGGAHVGIYSDYEILTNNEEILSIARYVVYSAGSSNTVYKFDTIDKKKQVLITLQSLFKDEQYVSVISENIIEQMREQIKKDSNITYWIDDSSDIASFEAIAANQNFYITDEGKLVISFDKYEVAPGYMGVREFVIPTEVITDQLVSSDYIH